MKTNWPIFRLVPMAFVMGTIFFLSHQPGDVFNVPPIPGIDKLAHLLLYALLAVSVLIGVVWSNGWRRPARMFGMTVLICVAFGVFDEYHQSFIPGRYASWLDLVADLAGAVLACFLYHIWSRR